MRVLVFDHSRPGGHIFNYHRLLLPALVPLADQVTVAVAEGVLDAASTRIQLRDMPPEIKWEVSIPDIVGSHLKRNLGFRRALVQAVGRHRPDHLFVPTADSLSQVLGVAAAVGRRDFPAGLEAEGAVHRCGFAYPAPSWQKKQFYQFGFWAHSRAPWTRLLNVDVMAYEWIQRHGGPLAQRNELLPDPIELCPHVDRHDARRRLSLPDDGPLVGCFGIMDVRKGIDLVLAAFRQAKLPPNTRLLLAGQQDKVINSLVSTQYADLVRSGTIICMDRYLSVDELGDAFAAMDLVCTPYPRQIAIASIVLRAAAAGRPVLASDWGWCARMVPRFQLGWTCNVFDAVVFGQAIAAALAKVDQWKPSPATQRLLEFHSPENFAATFTARLRQRVGQPPSKQIMPWDVVDRAADETFGERPSLGGR